MRPAGTARVEPGPGARRAGRRMVARGTVVARSAAAGCVPALVVNYHPLCPACPSLASNAPSHPPRFPFHPFLPCALSPRRTATPRLASPSVLRCGVRVLHCGREHGRGHHRGRVASLNHRTPSVLRRKQCGVRSFITCSPGTRPQARDSDPAATIKEMRWHFINCVLLGRGSGC